MSKKDFIIAKHENDELMKKIEELKEKMKNENISKRSSKRHYLRNNINKIVRCKGYLVRKNKYNDRYIVINILSADDGRFIADHIHLDMKLDEFKYVDYEICENSLIYFKGFVKEYTRNDKSIDYEVQVIEKPVWVSTLYYNDNWNPDEYFNEEPDIEKIFNYLYKKERVYLFNLVKTIRNEINRFTAKDFGKDYIYTYLMNTYLLNLASNELFCNSISSLQLTREGIINLILLSASIVMDLSTLQCTTIEKIFEIITYECNVIQNINKYDKSNKTNFVEFCNESLNIKEIKMIKELWNEILLRKKDFGENPNPYNVSKNAMITDAYKVLNKLIK